VNGRATFLHLFTIPKLPSVDEPPASMRFPVELGSAMATYPCDSGVHRDGVAVYGGAVVIIVDAALFALSLIVLLHVVFSHQR